MFPLGKLEIALDFPQRLMGLSRRSRGGEGGLWRCFRQESPAGEPQVQTLLLVPGERLP